MKRIDNILKSTGYKKRLEKYKWKTILNRYPSIQDIKKLYNSHTIKELSNLWNCSVDCVRTLRDKLHLTKKNVSQQEIISKYSKEQLEDMYLHKFDRRLLRMAEDLNVYHNTLSKVFKYLGIEQNPHHPTDDTAVRNLISTKAKERLSNKGYRENIRLKNTKYMVYATGETLTDICKKYNAPEYPARHIAQQSGLDAAVNYITANLDDTGKYKHHLSSLEVLFQNLGFHSSIKIERWNKRPESIIENIRPDFKLSYNGKTLYVDVHGLYFHCDIMQSDRRYHFSRRDTLEKYNLSYYQFFQDEVVTQGYIIVSIINNFFGLSLNRYQARKLFLRPTSSQEAKSFFDNNHLMGSTNARSIGLYDGDVLISCLSYKEFANKIEIARFATKVNSYCLGAFSKLLEFLKSKHKTIVSYCDLRYGTGNSYKLLGFKLTGITLGWQWTNFSSRYNRLKCTATKYYTEKENAEYKGWVKIYDAGQACFVLNR